MNNVELEVLNNLFRSTTNLQAFGTCCAVFPKKSHPAQCSELSRPQQLPHPSGRSQQCQEPEAPK